MLEVLRKRRNLGRKDHSIDEDLNALSPADAVREMAAWNLVNPQWADKIAGWMMEAGAKPEDFKNDVNTTRR